MKMLVLFGAFTPVQLTLLVGALLLLLALGPFVLGAVLIHERQVGVVVKRFSARSLQPGRLIALDGEAGYQADTLAPGLHFGYWRWQYRILKAPVIVVPQGEIALVVAADGAAMPAEHILGKVVECDTFQDARKFLLHGGEKGRQLGLITAGTYRINSALFTVIRAADAAHHAVILEEVAAMALGAVTINPAATPISRNLLDKHFLRKHGANAYYGQTGKAK